MRASRSPFGAGVVQVAVEGDCCGQQDVRVRHRCALPDETDGLRRTDCDRTDEGLLTDGTDILWSESLVIVCKGKVYLLPDARGLPQLPRPAVLRPFGNVGCPDGLKMMFAMPAVKFMNQRSAPSY